MADFLLEIYSEEIPAMMQKNAAEQFAKIAAEIFTKNNLQFEASQVLSFVSSRRLALSVINLQTTQKTPAIKRVGPKIDADEKAIAGFLRSVGINDKSQLQQVENGGSTCYAYVKAESEIQTTEIIKISLPQILQKMSNIWAKQMRWDIAGSAEQPRWIRPIRNIACLFGHEVLSIEFAGLKSNDQTFGHLLNGSQALKITNANNYRKILEDHQIIVDQRQRREKVVQQLHKITSDLSLQTVDDIEKSPLIDEVVGLCEWPTALIGNIEERFLQLPQEILILTLRLNQKYFCLKSQQGLASKFIFISNAITSNQNSLKKIIEGNEKLVRARLSDAEFFVSEDIKKSLISRTEELKKIIFHQKLGSVFDKNSRLESLAKFLSVFVPHCEMSLIERCANLLKADLTTKAVAEFPELQGKIGSFYAEKQSENPKISAAIREHYLPLGPASELPETPLGIAMSIADKIDSIVGFFLADEKPTSSRDPFGLRRATLGIIRISVHCNIAFPIRNLVEKSLNSYPTKLLKELLEKDNKKLLEAKKELVEEIIQFFIERLRSYIKDNEIAAADITKSVIDEYLSDLDKHKHCDIFYLLKKVEFLQKFISNPENKNVIQLYKRAANILAIEEKKDGKKYDGKPSLLALSDEYEKVLYRSIKQVKGDFKKLVIKGKFEEAFKLISQLELPLAKFFDKVVVNDSNKNLRENRLLLLSKIRSLFNQVADLSNIEIS